MSTNSFGLDIDYFEQKLARVLESIQHYKPDEIARELARLVVVADRGVLAEPEFNQGDAGAGEPVAVICMGAGPEANGIRWLADFNRRMELDGSTLYGRTAPRKAKKGGRHGR